MRRLPALAFLVGRCVGDARDVSRDLKSRVDQALRQFVTEAARPLRDVGGELTPLAESITAFVLDSGKRLRPAFCYWAARAAGAVDDDALVRAAASLELLQACALVHDDVIDHSDTRRGQPALHRQFAALHGESGWSGEPADFGAATAILAGDLLLAWSDSMLATSGMDDAALHRARPVSDLMRVELMAGQYLDILAQARADDPLVGALRVARYKAAKYTVEGPLHLGAALADAPAALTSAYTAYGVPLGEAFQLRDDLLGVFGDPAMTGKPAGDDLREGKRTALIAAAFERANAVDRATLHARLGDPDLSDRAVDEVRAIVTSSGATAAVEAMIDERVRDALAALDAADLRPEGRDALVTLASAATRRVE
jgi:geranylgeranyl diphosphate synthase type I